MTTPKNGKYLNWRIVATAACILLVALFGMLVRGQAETQAQQAETLDRVSRTQEGMSFWIKAVEKDVAENRDEINRLRDE